MHLRVRDNIRAGASDLTHLIILERKAEGCSRPGFKPVATVVKDSGFRLKAGQIPPLWGETFRNAAILACKADTDRATAAALQDT
jgi:hypothetical protein